MTKLNPGPPKRETHFEQVPVELVKRVAVPELSKKRRPGELVREPSGRKTEPYSIGAHRLTAV
jgi:hypothetical protein